MRLLCVLAHPDDESLGVGGVLARYAEEGVATFLLTATRGERGWNGSAEDYPGPAGLGVIREKELLAAAQILGVREVKFLDYEDGEVDQARPEEIINRIAGYVRRIRPDVVITFSPDGAYGHPDHIAISQFTGAALVRAASADVLYDELFLPPHQVSKFYYFVGNEVIAEISRQIFGDIYMVVDGVKRSMITWESWMITTWIDCSDYWEIVLNAIRCHKSQHAGYVTPLMALPEADHRRLWGAQTLYRAFSLVNGGREVENDLFIGLR